MGVGEWAIVSLTSLVVLILPNVSHRKRLIIVLPLVLSFEFMIFFTFTNSVDPDEMQHYAAFIGFSLFAKVLV